MTEKTLDEFVEPERRLRLTQKGKEWLGRRKKTIRVYLGIGTDSPMEPHLRNCESLCTPEDIDLCRNRGQHVCRRRYK